MATSSFLDRLRGTGPLTPDRARQHGALGPIGKAAGFADDARLARPYDAYPVLGLDAGRPHSAGDAMARLRVRWEEVDQSFGLLRRATDDLSAERPGELPRVPCAPASGRAVGWAEAPQGEVVYDVRLEGRPHRPLPSQVGVIPQPGADARGVRRRHPDRLPVHRGQLRPVRGRGGAVSLWVLRGLRDGVVTTRWPRRRDEYADAWRGPGRRCSDAARPPARPAAGARARPARS